MDMNSCFIMGHRPSRFQFSESSPMCQRIKDVLKNELRRLYDEQGIRGVWVGGAAGVDTWAAEIVLDLHSQTNYQDMALFLAIPFPEFGATFVPKQKERYQRLLQECTDSVTVCRAYRLDAYKRRNYYMVDHSVCGIAVYDQDRSIRSSTGMTVNYAEKKRHLKILFIHPDNANIQSNVPVYLK